MSIFFAGLDWASQSHALCIIDERGEICERLEIEHNAAGLARLQRRLAHFGRPRIAIERPSGLIVDTLVDAGFAVVPIHPNAVKATRPRYRSHGAKSDASDAYLLADLLRTDGHRFAPLAPQSDEIRALRALVRGRDDLVATRTQLANQLRSLLESFWPGAALVFAEIDSPIALAFIERYPTPESASRLAAEAGVAPVTYASGKSKTVAFRWACNHRLRAALTCLADNSRHASTWAAHVYSQARARGCDHPHAVRILARAWTRVIWRAWTDRKPYDPARHLAATALLETAKG
ncbi:MAG TPA: transposase [Burkholderiales bacterium]|nr:transposase [Burkholderiales bacterium]